jgi:hypothetical protein
VPQVLVPEVRQNVDIKPTKPCPCKIVDELGIKDKTCKKAVKIKAEAIKLVMNANTALHQQVPFVLKTSSVFTEMKTVVHTIKCRGL